MSGRIRYFGLSDDKLLYDERKKRFVYLEDAPAIVEKNFKNSHFKEVLINYYMSYHYSKDQIYGVKNAMNLTLNSSMDNNYSDK